MSDHLEQPSKLAMTAARSAWPSWSAASLRKRLSHISTFSKLLLERADEAVELLSSELHKTPIDALTGDVYSTLSTASLIRKHAAKALKTRRLPASWLSGEREIARLHYESYGVVAVAGPWNFPLSLSFIPSLYALAAGNTVVLKVSEKISSLSAWMAELTSQSGFPEGVFQIVEGGPDAFEVILSDRPDYVFYTGGEAGGIAVGKRCAELLIPCTLELGGKDPLIVCEDAGLERAAKAAVWGSFMNSGQVCASVEKVYVDRKVLEKFTLLAAKETELLTSKGQPVKLIKPEIIPTAVPESVEAAANKPQTMGQNNEGSNEAWQRQRQRQSYALSRSTTTVPCPDLGGMGTKEAWDHGAELLEDALAKGAMMLTSRMPHEEEYPYFPPIILTNVTPTMRLWEEELFAPIMPIIPYNELTEVIRMERASNYGLSASIFSQDKRKAKALAHGLQVGSVAVNSTLSGVTRVELPFGGVKGSGFGRYRGAEGVRVFTRAKVVTVSGGRRIRALPWFPYKASTYQLLHRWMKWRFR